MHANQREDLDVAMAGDIVAGLGFKDTTHRRHAVRPQPPDRSSSGWSSPSPSSTWPSSRRPRPTRTSWARPSTSLSDEDPTFRVRTDEETGQTVISGMGELHLEVLVDRMLREFSVDATVGKPQVAYRETITKTVEYGRVPPHQADRWLRPVRRRQDQPRADRPRRRLRVRRQDHRRHASRASTSPPVDQGIQAALDAGVLAGYPTVDVKATLVDGQYHDVDSSEMAFKIAGSMAFKEAARRPSRCCSSRSWRVEVVTPEDYMGDVMGDLSQPPRPRRGHGAAGQHPGRPGPGAAVGDVRLRYRPPFADPGPGHVHDAVRLVPAGARSDRQEEIVKRVRGE